MSKKFSSIRFMAACIFHKFDNLITSESISIIRKYLVQLKVSNGNI